jgi:hypothetical protein
LCDVYAVVIAFNEIRCQDCGKIFKVSLELSRGQGFPRDLPKDPGICGTIALLWRSADSLNFILQRILEYWYRTEKMK